MNLKTALIIGTVASLALPASVATYISDSTYSQSLEVDLGARQEELLQVLAYGVSEPLWNFDDTALQEIANEVIVNELIASIKITDESGNLRAQAVAPNRKQTNLKTRDVIRQNHRIGRVTLVANPEPLSRLIAGRKMTSFATISIEAIFILLFLTIFYWFRFAAPLKRLAGQATQLSLGELSTPFVWKSNDEISLLGKALEYARTKLRTLLDELAFANKELEKVNVNLESLVRSRTKTINTILDHVKFGFMLINSEGIVEPGYSRCCIELLGIEQISGLRATDVFGIQGDDKEQFEILLGQVFEDIFPEELNLAQFPKRISLKTRGKERNLALEASSVRNGQGKIGQLLVSLHDTTELDSAQKEALHDKSLIGILKNANSFRLFLKEAKLGLAMCLSSLDDIAIVRRQIHTIKGNVAAFGIDKIVKIVDKIEDKSQISRTDLLSIEFVIRSFLDENHSILGLTWDEDLSLIHSISAKSIAAIEADLQAAEELGQDTKLARHCLSVLNSRPVTVLLGPVAEYAAAMARRLGKNCQVIIEDNRLEVDSEKFANIVQNITHLVRNSIVHGIEEVELRGNKPPCGKIEIIFCKNENALQIEISDDGRGVDVQRLKQLALDRGLIEERDILAMEDESAYMLMFYEGLSTAHEVDDLAGRGLGMQAVLEAVTRMGGELRVTSRPGLGTTIAITIPLTAL